MLIGGFTFLQWPLRPLFNHASGPRMCNASSAAYRFLAAFISAWFSLNILNYKGVAKVDREGSKQATQDRHYGPADDVGLISQNTKTTDTKDFLPRPTVMAGKTIDLTLFAVTRAFDSIVVNLYRRSYQFADAAPAVSSLTVMARHADTIIFALSSGTVVRLHIQSIASILLMPM